MHVYLPGSYGHTVFYFWNVHTSIIPEFYFCTATVLLGKKDSGNKISKYSRSSWEHEQLPPEHARRGEAVVEPVALMAYGFLQM